MMDRNETPPISGEETEGALDVIGQLQYTPIHPIADYGQADPIILCPEDRRSLEVGSGIDRQVIQRRGYLTVQDKRELEAYGHPKTNSRIPALVVPLHSPDGTTLYQLRPHASEKRSEDAPKYLLPPKARLVVDVNPIARHEVLNPDIPLWVTEGAKKADSAISKGLACISLIGVDSWKQDKLPLGDWFKIPLKDRTVTIVFDSDAKEETRIRVYFAQRKFATFLRSQGAKVRFVILPCSDGEKVGLDDFFVNGGKIAYLEELALEELPSIVPSGSIVANERQLREITGEALALLIEKNEPPRLFVQNGKLTRLSVNEKGIARQSPLTEDQAIHELAGVVNWMNLTEKRGFVSVFPPYSVARDLLAFPSYPDFPPLKMIAAAPTFTASGKLHATLGYCEESEVYYSPPQGFDLPDTTPTKAKIAESLSLLAELIEDFPLVGNASKTHALAYLLLPFVRPLINGNTPIHIFDAPTPRTGKSLLCELLTTVFSATATMQILPTEEPAIEKQILSSLLESPSHIIFDNVRRANSPCLFGVVTTPHFAGRVLGVSLNANVEIACVWGMTANNCPMTEELAHRSVVIRLDSGIEHPGERRGFKHPNLREWVKINRSRLVGACCTLVRAWVEAGQPQYRGDECLGNFESWVSVMGGLLEFHGFTGLLSNRKTLTDRIADEGANWHGFTHAWFEEHGQHPVPSKTLFSLAETFLPRVLGDKPETPSAKIRLGRALQNHIDRRFGEYKITQRGRSTERDTKDSPLYALEKEESGGSGGSGGSVVTHAHRNEESFSPEHEKNVCTTHESGGKLPALPALPADNSAVKPGDAL